MLETLVRELGSVGLGFGLWVVARSCLRVGLDCGESRGVVGVEGQGLGGVVVVLARW
jgi:hypothetical protein